MASRTRKRRTRRGEIAQTRRPRAAKESERRPDAQVVCWLCSRPLGAGPVKSMLGFGVLAVHQRCYDEALKA